MTVLSFTFEITPWMPALVTTESPVFSAETSLAWSLAFLLIRPQQRKAKDHAKLVSALKTGDSVVTNAGIHGVISNVKDKTVIVKIADNVKVEFDRAAIVTIEASSSENAA